MQPSVARSILEETMKDGKSSVGDEHEIASALGALYTGESHASQHIFCEMRWTAPSGTDTVHLHNSNTFLSDVH